MSPELRHFAKKVGFFLLPFAVYACAIVVIDPYNYFGVSRAVSNDLKKDISFKLNYAMWAMLDYRRDPTANILLGDSRMLGLHAEDIRAVSGHDFRNLAYGGGSLREAIATFKFAEELVDLKRVKIGLDINTYNGSDSKNRVSEVEAALGNPLLYVTNNNVMRASWMLVGAAVTGRPARIGVPAGDREEFWRKQLDVTARLYLANYRDPSTYRAQLGEIAELCRAKGIELQFIIFPSHQDLMDKIEQYDLVEANRVMREDLASWGQVYDFAWTNPLTTDKASFTDPFHFTRDVAREIVRSVWGDVRDHVKVYGPNETAAPPLAAAP